MTVTRSRAKPPRPPREAGANRAGGSDAAARPASSVAELVRRHGAELLQFAYLVSGDRHRAEDLLQDSLLALHRRFGDELPVENPVGYARRTIINTHISWTRRSMNSEMATDVVPEQATDASSGSDPAERDALWQALRRLPVRQRTALVLRFYADVPDDEIADALNCRRGTVRSLVSRALDAMRDDPALDYVGGAS